jgi:excisionase family DNA binding protein
VARDLTDREVARELGKHLRTIQRWSRAGVLPGARKVGRSWRIPPEAVRATKAAQVKGGDQVVRDLRAAAIVCGELKRELEIAKDPRSAPVERNWRGVAREIEKLHQALAGLPSKPSEVPGWLDAHTPPASRRSR